MYKLTEAETREVGGGGPGADLSEFGNRPHPPGAWLDINSGPVVEVLPGVWERVPGT